METRTLKSRDDLGFVDRRDEATACEGGGQKYCAVIDDASVYFKTMSTPRQDAIYTQAMDDAPGYPGLPTGRIPAFYRCLIIQRLFQSLGNRNPTIGEMIRVLEVVDAASRGGRVDDAWATNTMVRHVLALKLNSDEQRFVEVYAGAKSKDGGSEGSSEGGVVGAGGLLLVGAALVGAYLIFKAVK